MFLHNTFPFERFMGVLKKYVHQRARPEGSITEGYGTVEVIEFCVEFIPKLDPIGVPESQHEGRLSGKGTVGKKTYISTGDDYFNKAHYTVLQNSSLWSRMSRNTRTFYDPNSQRRTKHGLCVNTCTLLMIGYEKNVRIMTRLMSNCIFWLGNHHGTSSRTKGMR